MKWMFIVLFATVTAHAQGFAIVVQDDTPLRSTPAAAERPSALLWQGETVEVRGERLDYLQVWDYARERGGYVRAAQLRRIAMSADEAPELLSILRFLRGMPGAEALGIGIAAAYIEAAPAQALNGPDGVEALEALGALAERLARRASPHLEVAARYGVRFISVEHNGRIRLCYDGAAYRRILAMRASDEQRARAALALSEPACTRPDITVTQLLEQLDESALAGYLRNRVLLRRAASAASLAFERARRGEDPHAAAERARQALGAVRLEELAEVDRRAHGETQLRVAALRWAGIEPRQKDRRIRVTTAAGEEGRTCVVLSNAKDEPLARRCTFGIVWAASAVVNRDATALALAVQPAEAWRELWVFRRTKTGWTLRVLPPAASAPGVGSVEFAGWRRGAIRVARAAVVDGRVRRSVQTLRLG